MALSKSLKPIPFGIFFVLHFISPNANSQILQTSINSSIKNDFSYQITTTIGTRTSADISGNLITENEAILNLQPGSIITNKIGDDNGNASAVFAATPNGASVNLTGITGENLFITDEGSSFRSSMSTLDPNLQVPSKGEASATAVQSTTVKVESGTSTLINTFQQAF